MFSTGQATAGWTGARPINSLQISSFKGSLIFWETTQANPLTGAIHQHIVVERLISTESGGDGQREVRSTARDLLDNQSQKRLPPGTDTGGGFFGRLFKSPNKTLKSLDPQTSQRLPRGVAGSEVSSSRNRGHRHMTNRSTKARFSLPCQPGSGLWRGGAGKPHASACGLKVNEPASTG